VTWPNLGGLGCYNNKIMVQLLGGSDLIMITMIFYCDEVTQICEKERGREGEGGREPTRAIIFIFNDTIFSAPLSLSLSLFPPPYVAPCSTSLSLSLHLLLPIVPTILR
jgi:hypothetical protein